MASCRGQGSLTVVGGGWPEVCDTPTATYTMCANYQHSDRITRQTSALVRTVEPGSLPLKFSSAISRGLDGNVA